MALDEREVIRDRGLLIRSGIVLVAVMVGFVAHSALHVEPSLVALLGAGALVALSKLDPPEFLEEVEWSTLVFFMGLFVMVGALVEVGVIGRLGEAVTDAVGDRYLLASSVLLWGSALLSGIVDNIPYVATVTPLVQNLVDAGQRRRAGDSAVVGTGTRSRPRRERDRGRGQRERRRHRHRRPQRAPDHVLAVHQVRLGRRRRHHRSQLGLPVAALLRGRVITDHATQNRPDTGASSAVTPLDPTTRTPVRIAERRCARRPSAGPAAVRGRAALRLGELAVVGRLYASLRVTSIGPQALHLRPRPGVGVRRAARDLLLRRRAELKREFVAVTCATRRVPPSRSPPRCAASSCRRCSTPRSTSADPAPSAAGPFPPRPTSRSRSRCWPSSAPTCPPRCAPSCSPWPWSTTSAIIIIATFYTGDLLVAPCCSPWSRSACSPWLQQPRIQSWWLLLPLGLVLWALVHASGVHATVAGVLLGCAARVRPHRRRGGSRRAPRAPVAPPVRRFAVPVFAFFAAGVTVGGRRAGRAPCDPAAVGILAGLVVGKPLGVLAGTLLIARFTRAS